MLIDKKKIVDLLASRGEQAAAVRADASLPTHVNTDEHRETLSALGLDVTDLGNLAGDFSL